MNNKDTHRLLEQICDLQKQQLECQAQLLQAQRDFTAMYKSHIEQVERINDKAESLQDRGATMMNAARKAFAIIIAIVTVLIVYLSWLLFL